MKKNILLITMLVVSVWSYSQQIIWTGNAGNNDFFDEDNWQDNTTNLPPASGKIDVNQAINLDLQLHDANALISASGIINLGSGSLSVTASQVEANAFSGGSVTINNEAYVDLSAISPLQNNVSINLTSGIGWIRALNKKGSALFNDNLSQIEVNGAASSYQSNLRLDNYYENGTVIRSNDLTTSPLTIYDDTNLQGISTNLSLDIIHSGTNIPNTMNNKAESFLLKKGFMVTFAVTEDGTGKSKNYIASEDDLTINELPDYLLNEISFIRVMPWNWVTKKGIGGNTSSLNNGWFYRWNNSGTSSLDIEYAPMAWGFGGANDDGDIALYKSKYKATHVLAFNESDNCDDQSGQYNNLCDTDVAVSTYKNLMKTGLRLVSPSGRENAPFGWLKEFHEKANAQDIRIDVIGVHWYDWGSNPANSPNANPNVVFNRFKNYLQNVYDLYGLPIWITEFNANPNRSTATNLGFMELALPYLETLDYVERYAWFQPNSDVADYYDTNGNITNVGTFYRDQISTPSVPEATLLEDNNLDMYYNALSPSVDNLLINGDFELGDLTGWNGGNINILANSNVYEGTTSGRILANSGNIYQTVTVESLADYNLSFYARWFISPPSAIQVQLLNATNDAVIASKTMTTSTDWNLVTLNFTVPASVTSIKFFVEKEASYPGWFIDNAILAKSDALSIDNLSYNLFKIYPNPSAGIFILKSQSLINSYAIYDIQGKLISRKSELNIFESGIDLSNHKRGIYFMTVSDSEGNITSKKLIVN